jgi:hypothetical protein
MKHTPPTQQELQEKFDYNPETGVFALRKTRGKRQAGAEPGCLSPQGYRQIGIKGSTYGAHRLAWLYIHGVWHFGDIDHINHKRDDNRICNLRAVDRSLNLLNVRPDKAGLSGYRGVSPKSAKKRGTKRWCAYIKVYGKSKHLGDYYTLDEAIAARRAALIVAQIFAQTTQVTLESQINLL